MITDSAIIDTPLPPALNFNWLKTKGIAYLQILTGEQWTNFNDSDPGVTILDQLCYALTELGYCIDFPIADILTNSDGRIKYHQQFFLPQDILTCAPITIDDYRKFLLDAMPGISNVYIETDDSILGVYQVYLVPDEAYLNGTIGASVQADVTEIPIEPLDKKQQLQNQAQQLLEQHRNITEWFATVVVLEQQSVGLKGNIILSVGANQQQVSAQIKTVLAEWVSPAIVRYGYDSLIEQGYTTDEIFNGPLLANGWIKDQDLATSKRSCIEVKTISGLIAGVTGVDTVSSLILLQHDNIDHECLTIDNDKVAQFDIDQLNLIEPITAPKSLEQQLNDDLQLLSRSHQTATVGASVNIAPTPPEGDYRQISDYYSIQNTFPTEYGVGIESAPAGASDFRIAQIRQLKGYLTIFDQVLANQFSQLSELGQLFSFEPASTIGYENTVERQESYGGIPYQLFAPTYFSQPVYNIPDVQPLLLGNETYRFGSEPLDTKAQQQRIWQQYQNDPFNRYIHGMRKDVENDSERDDRQQRILDHLLARHGESATDIDNIIITARWYGSTSQTRIILKRILLQNYQSLSYRRVKGPSYLFRDKLKVPGRYQLVMDAFEKVVDFGLQPGMFAAFADFAASNKETLVKNVLRRLQTIILSKDWDKATIVQFLQTCLQFEDNFVEGKLLDSGLYSDGQLNMKKLSRQEKIREQDFVNFATPELYMNLLLGLVSHYTTCLDVLYSLVSDDDFATWLEQHPANDSEFNLADAVMSISVKRQIDEDGSVDTVSFNQVAILTINQQRENAIVAKSTNITIKSYYKQIEQLQWLQANTKGCLFLEPIAWLGSVSDVEQLYYANSYYQLLTILCIPSYICSFDDNSSSTNLYQQIELMVAKLWPVQVNNALLTLDFSDMDTTIRQYVRWQNAYLKTNNEGKRATKIVLGAANRLAKLLFPLIYSDLQVQGGSDDTAE